MGWASYSFMFPEHIWEFLDNFVSSQNSYKDEPSLFD